MPRARVVLNAFTSAEVAAISGLSLPMVHYLAREGVLVSAYGGPESRRGRVRFYSYRDLVVARLIQRFRECGVEIQRLKTAVRKIASDSRLVSDAAPTDFSCLVFDGRDLAQLSLDGFAETFRDDKQRSFGFVIDVHGLKEDVRARLSPEKLSRFTMLKKKLVYAA